jgi:hypothetical protein
VLLVGLPIELQQKLTLHLQLHLRVLLEDLGVTLTQQLGDPFVGNAASRKPGGIRRTQIVNPKIRNAGAAQRCVPGPLERLLMGNRICAARKESRPGARQLNLVLECL